MRIGPTLTCIICTIELASKCWPLLPPELAVEGREHEDVPGLEAPVPGLDAELGRPELEPSGPPWVGRQH